MRPGIWLAGIVLFVSVYGAWAQRRPKDPGDIAAGKKLVHNWTETGLACFHCHADFNEKKESDDLLRCGHPLYNVGFRSEWHAWKGKVVGSLDEAVEICMTRWMTHRDSTGVGTPPAKHHLRQILAYLRSEGLSPERKSKGIIPMWAEKVPADDLLKVGDANKGTPIFRRACLPCHPTDRGGPGPSLIRNGYSRYQIAKKIREIDNSGLDGLVMPPFPKDRLSDRQLINVVAFVYEM
ncbi:MAG: c-type cytochrome [Candidatus Latescibacteria bacterium]|jgi:mono/diheme cytochrome c family protein|nr:c-type cytochrome [Candidatus Latescibacterota bacterium]